MNKKVFFIKQSLRSGVLNKFNSAVTNQRLSSDEIELLSWQKRKTLLAHAYKHSKFYRSRFAEIDLHPEDIKNENDWNKIPILTKDEIRFHNSSIMAEDVSRHNLRLVATGGSTGEPLKLYHDNRFPHEILGWRMLEWWGVNPSDDAAYCWRIIRKDFFGKFVNRLMWWPTRRIWLDASIMTEESVRLFISKFNQLKPRFFQGYTGSIEYVARFIIDNRISIHSPVCIWGTSSPISATQRRLIEGAFNAPLYDQYGCSEIYWLAAQCKIKHGLHVFSDSRHLEFIDDSDNPVEAGLSGRAIITDLENYAFPLIKYENGDIGRYLKEQCSCGVNLPLIAPVNGRISDLIRLPDGSAIGGDFITTLFDDFPDHVKAFQVRQASDGSIKLLVIPASDLSKSKYAADAVIKNLKSKSKKMLPISCEFISSIASDRGKTRFVVSDYIDHNS